MYMNRQSLPEGIEEVWVSFLRWQKVPKQFPREITLTRVVASSLQQYLMYLRRGWSGHCYTSVYSLPQIERGIVDTVYFEIDAPTIDMAKRSAEILERALDEKGLAYRKYFSGRRGFHYYLDFDPVVLSNPSGAMSQFVGTLPEVMDPNCIGRVRQLARVPYTRHPKTGLMSFRVYDRFSFSEALRPELRDDGPVDNPDLPGILRSFDEEVAERKETRHYGSTRLEYFPPCIISALRELNSTGYLTHQKRLHLASFLLMVGWDVEDVIDVFRVADDFKEKYTRYQVERLAHTHAKCFSCRKAATEGVCPVAVQRGEEDCGFFPSINRYILGDTE